MTNLFLTTAFALLALLAPLSQAAIVVYNTQASFLAAVSNPGVDSFDDLNSFIGQSYPSPVARMAGPSYGYLATVLPIDTFFVAGSGNDSWLSTNTSSDTIRFDTFNTAISAIGGFFFATDINGQVLSGQTVLVEVWDGVETRQASLDSTSDASGTFVGFVSTAPILWLDVSAQQPVDVTAPYPFPTVNDLTLASPVSSSSVPEPASIALTAMALAGCFGAGLKTRRAQP